MRLAVTGVSGFCGRYLARVIGPDVVCLGRRPGPVGTHRFWDATLGSPDLSTVDGVIHVAAAGGDPGDGAEPAFRAVNVHGTARLLDAAAGRPVVYVSSASVYDPRVDRTRVREEHPVGG